MVTQSALRKGAGAVRTPFGRGRAKLQYELKAANTPFDGQDLGAAPSFTDTTIVAGQTIANAVVVGVDSNGRIRVHNAAGSTHVIVDVVGFVAA